MMLMFIIMNNDVDNDDDNDDDDDDDKQPEWHPAQPAPSISERLNVDASIACKS